MKTQKAFRVALVSTDSLRGKEIKAALSDLKFPINNLELFDPDVQEEYCKLTQFEDIPRVIHHLEPELLEGLDLVFLAADAKTGRECGAFALRKKMRAVDLSGAFSGDPKVPVPVAGVNSDLVLRDRPYLVANPHAVTIILSHIFHLVIPRFGLSRAVAFVLQPVSAFDEAGIEELAGQSASLLSSAAVRKKVFKEQIAFNLLSHTEAPDADGFSPSERQILSEIGRVFQRPEFPLSLSIIQAPVFHTYAVMAYLELERETDIKALEDLFKSSPLFKVPAAGKSCPVTSLSVAGKDRIYLGQIKKEPVAPRSFWIWTVTDNLTFGSALNAVEIGRGLLAAALKDRA